MAFWVRKPTHVPKVVVLPIKNESSSTSDPRGLGGKAVKRHRGREGVATDGRVGISAAVTVDEGPGGVIG